jgi:hypothetical protein
MNKTEENKQEDVLPQQGKRPESDEKDQALRP